MALKIIPKEEVHTIHNLTVKFSTNLNKLIDIAISKKESNSIENYSDVLTLDIDMMNAAINLKNIALDKIFTTRSAGSVSFSWNSNHLQ